MIFPNMKKHIGPLDSQLGIFHEFTDSFALLPSSMDPPGGASAPLNNPHSMLFFPHVLPVTDLPRLWDYTFRKGQEGVVSRRQANRLHQAFPQIYSAVATPLKYFLPFPGIIN